MKNFIEHGTNINKINPNIKYISIILIILLMY